MTKLLNIKKGINLYNNDCLTVLKQLGDNSIDLICTDPPYYKVKSNKWDNQWASVEEFFSWLDEILFELWRVLKPSGSLYLFCSPQLSAETEVLIKQRFNVLNNIIWAKPTGRWLGCNKESLRSYFPQTEHIIFAGHYNSEGKAKGSSNYHSKCTEVRKSVFEPLIQYFKNSKDALGITAKEINKATGKQMSSHWFSSSQWQLPNKADYKKLQRLFKKKGDLLNIKHSELVDTYDQLHKQYSELTVEYSELKKEYELLRRPFNVNKHVPYTNVWHFPIVQPYPGKHPCEKPYDLIEHIIKSSSRKGDVVLDCFMGSNKTGKVCFDLQLDYIGIELEEESFEKSVDVYKT